MARPALPHLDPVVLLDKVKEGKATRQYRAKQTIFSQGDAADAVFYVQSGQVKLTVVSVGGKAAVIAILGPGSFFGEGCLAGQPLRMSTASAVPSSSIVRIEKKTMVSLL